jgi:hypothetical protein
MRLLKELNPLKTPLLPIRAVKTPAHPREKPKNCTCKQLFSSKDLVCVTQPTIFALANQEQRF